MILRIAIIILAFVSIAAKRAKPPEKWDSSAGIFETNAFKILEGERPKNFNIAKKEPEPQIEENKEENGDFDRSDMMKKLRSAEDTMAEGVSSSKAFKSSSHKIDSSADLMIMMGRSLFNSDPDYNEEDYYLKQAEEMTSNAKLIKYFIKKQDYEGAVRAFSNIKKSCDNCHQKFR